MEETLTVPQWMEGVSALLERHSTTLDHLVEMGQTADPQTTQRDNNQNLPATQGMALDELVQAARDGQIVDQKGVSVPLGQVLAELEASPITGAIRSLDNLGGQGLPLGSAAVGGFAGLAVSEIVDGFSAPTPGTLNGMNALLKVGGAWASVQFLPQFAGKTSGVVSASILILSVLRDFLPMDQWIQKLKEMFSGISFGQGQMGYALNPGYSQQLPSAPQQQVIPGRGGAGHDSLAGVFE